MKLTDKHKIKYNNAMEEQVQNKDFMPKAQVEIMLEGIRSDFKVFGEKLDGIDTRLMNVENKVDVIEEKVERIDLRLINVENRLVDVENKVEAVDARLISIENKSDLILEDIDAVKANNVNSKEINIDHENRILKLEKSSLAIG